MTNYLDMYTLAAIVNEYLVFDALGLLMVTKIQYLYYYNCIVTTLP